MAKETEQERLKRKLAITGKESQADRTRAKRGQKIAWKATRGGNRAAVVKATGYTGPPEAEVSPGKKIARKARKK